MLCWARVGSVVDRHVIVVGLMQFYKPAHLYFQHLFWKFFYLYGVFDTAGLLTEFAHSYTFFFLWTAEVNCWQDWLVFSDIFFFLMKSGCIDFVDFVDKLVSRLTEGDQHILRTNHVTWLLAQIIRVELVMNALTTDARKVVLVCKAPMPCYCCHI